MSRSVLIIPTLSPATEAAGQPVPPAKRTQVYPTRTELRARYIGVLIERMANKPYDPAACDHIEELLLLWRSSGEGR